MKKLILIPALFLFLLSLALPRTASAQSCCPDTGSSPYKYTYDPATQKCLISGPQGQISVNSNCSSQQFCDTSTKQCVSQSCNTGNCVNDCVCKGGGSSECTVLCKNGSPPPTSSGCGLSSAGRQFCVKTAYNYNVYCSTVSECDEYKKAYANWLNVPQSGTTSKITCTPAGGKTGEGVQTAIGCIPYGDTSAFAGFFIGWGIGIGGGIAFLLTLYAGFMIMTSSGNPERLKAGQELLTSALAGLIMIVFSVFILRIIGVNILGIFK